MSPDALLKMPLQLSAPLRTPNWKTCLAQDHTFSGAATWLNDLARIWRALRASVSSKAPHLLAEAVRPASRLL